MNRLAAVLASKFSAVALIPVVFGVAQAIDCRRLAATPEQVQSCWRTGLAISGLGGAALAGYNIPNPKLDKARHELAVELDRPTERAAAAPPPPLPEPPVLLDPPPGHFEKPGLLDQELRDLEPFKPLTLPELEEEEEEELPEGWERDIHGRLHDEEGRYVSEGR